MAKGWMRWCMRGNFEAVLKGVAFGEPENRRRFPSGNDKQWSGGLQKIGDQVPAAEAAVVSMSFAAGLKPRPIQEQT